MLLRFGVENHLSIRERQEIVLTAAKRVKRSPPAVAVPILKEAAVPVAVLYGANAAGKSNLIHAIRMMREHIVSSHKSRDAADGVPRHPFLLDDSSADKPTRFDSMVTICRDDAQEVYEYGFSYTDTEFTDEWLHRIVRHKRQTTQMLFHRTTEDGDVQVSFGSQLRGENRAIASLTRPNSLFLSAAAQNNHAQLGAIHRQFVEQWQLDRGACIEPELVEMFARLEYQDAFIELMRQADLGVVDGELEDYDRPEAEREDIRRAQRAFGHPPSSTNQMDELALPQKRFRFTHATAGGARPLDYEWESHGTQMLTTLAIPMLNAISKGSLVVADELDSSLHHRLTEALLRLFKDATNRKGAQLIAAVHDTALLRDGLELDEVWLVEKDASGASRFTPLTDFRLRSREDLEKVYREGGVGGAPVVGDLAVALDG